MMGFKPLRITCVGVVVTALASAVALAASGSSLKIVLPANAHTHHTFTYSIDGTFSTSFSSRAWVIVLDQAKARACALTRAAGLEGAVGRPGEPDTGVHFSVHAARKSGSATATSLCACAPIRIRRCSRHFGNAGSAHLLATAHTVIPK